MTETLQKPKQNKTKEMKRKIKFMNNRQQLKIHKTCSFRCICTWKRWNVYLQTTLFSTFTNILMFYRNSLNIEFSLAKSIKTKSHVQTHFRNTLQSSECTRVNRTIVSFGCIKNKKWNRNFSSFPYWSHQRIAIMWALSILYEMNKTDFWT